MTVPDLYGQITEADVPGAEPGLLRVLNRLQSSIQSGLTGGVTLTDNFKGDVVTGVFSHGVATQVKLTKVKTPGSAVVLGADGQFALSASVVAGGAGGAKVTVLFADPAAKNVQATLLVTPEGTKTRSVANPNPTQSGSTGAGAASASAFSVLAGGNTFLDMPAASCSFTPLSTTKATLLVMAFSGFATGAAGPLQVRVASGTTGVGAVYNFFYNTLLQHQGWTFQGLFGSLSGLGLGSTIPLSIQVRSPTGSATQFNQDFGDSCSIVVQELG